MPLVANWNVASCQTDSELLEMADVLLAEEQLLEAARLLEKVHDQRRITERHHRIIKTAKDCQDSVVDLIGDPDEGWIRQGESHGDDIDTLIFYKLEGSARLTCRIETPIEQSLLVPLLSVLNEVDLYQDWIPSFRVPRLGIRMSRVIREFGRRRCNKLLQILCDVAWPFHPREVIIQATAIDDISESGFIIIRLTTVADTDAIPTTPMNVTRTEFQGTIMFRACPLGHASMLHSKRKYSEPLILVTFKMFCDPKMAAVPSSVVNFVTRTAIGSMWTAFIKVAMDVRDKKRPAHAREIDRKKVFYEWVADRVKIMLSGLEYGRFVNYLQG